eukprot:8209094-Alexandrium_andersonii.AAC.1
MREIGQDLARGLGQRILSHRVDHLPEWGLRLRGERSHGRLEGLTLLLGGSGPSAELGLLLPVPKPA